MSFMFIWVWILTLIISAIFFKGYNEEKLRELEQSKLNEANLINFFKGVNNREVMRIFMLHKDVVEDTSENPWAAQVKTAVNEILNLDRSIVDLAIIEDPPQDLKNGMLIVRPINPTPATHRGPHMVDHFLIREDVQGSTAVLRSTTIVLRVVHPFRWAALATVIIFFVKVT